MGPSGLYYGIVFAMGGGNHMVFAMGGGGGGGGGPYGTLLELHSELPLIWPPLGFPSTHAHCKNKNNE